MEWYTAPEAAQLLGVTAEYLRYLIRTGRIKATRRLPGLNSGGYRIGQDEIDRLKNPPEPAQVDDQDLLATRRLEALMARSLSPVLHCRGGCNWVCLLFGSGRGWKNNGEVSCEPQDADGFGQGATIAEAVEMAEQSLPKKADG